MKKWLLCYACGSLGGLSSSLVVWAAGDFKITTSAGVSIAPVLTLAWLYPRIVQSGLWGLLFMLPIAQSRVILKGGVLSLVVSMVQLFIILPYLNHKGIAGINLGWLTPVFIIFFNWIWGVTTALCLRISRS